VLAGDTLVPPIVVFSPSSEAVSWLAAARRYAGTSTYALIPIPGVMLPASFSIYCKHQLMRRE
jgi:hypothetical protein